MGAGSDGSTAGERCRCSVMSRGVLGWFSKRQEKGSRRKMWRMNGGTDLPEMRRLAPRDGKCTLTMSDTAEVNWLLSTAVFSEVGQGEL